MYHVSMLFMYNKTLSKTHSFFEGFPDPANENMLCHCQSCESHQVMQEKVSVSTGTAVHSTLTNLPESGAGMRTRPDILSCGEIRSPKRVKPDCSDPENFR